MGQKIVGLELGSGSIRVVTLRQGLWGIEGGECHSIEFENGVPSEEGIREGLQSLAGAGLLKGETVIVSLPGDEVMTRIISLPFEDPKKIAQVVPFEIEGFLPMNVEDLIIDHQILARREGTSEVLVTAAPKKTVERYLEWLREVGIDPKIIELDSMALFNLARFFGSFHENGNLLIDIGRRRSSLCIIKNGVLRMVRTVLFGEEQMEKALSEKVGCEINEARAYLRRLGLKNQEGTQGRLEEFSPMMEEALEPFVKEMMTTLQFTQQQGEEIISHLFVCGEGSQIPGVPEYLAHTLEMSLIPVNEGGPNSSKRTFSLKKKESLLGFLPQDEKGLYMPALGLVLKEVLGEEGSWINFRKGEFVYGKETQAFRRRLLIVGGLVLMILSAGLLDLYIHYHVKDSRYQNLKGDLRQTYRAMFPNAKNIVNELQQTRSALGEMKKKINKIGTGQVTPLMILAELTSRIPEEADIEVYDLIIDQSKVRMEAEAASFDAIDSIKKSFLKVEEVKEVVVSDARVSAREDRIKFRVTLEWREGI